MAPPKRTVHKTHPADIGVNTVLHVPSVKSLKKNLMIIRHCKDNKNKNNKNNQNVIAALNKCTYNNSLAKVGPFYIKALMILNLFSLCYSSQ